MGNSVKNSMKDISYKQKYEPIRCWFLQSGQRLKALRVIYKTVPLIIAAIYTALGAYLFIHRDYRLAGFIGVPAVVFAAVSVIRRAVNKKRPYEGEKAIVPLIAKDKRGRSFPSRHALSAALIASSCLLINIYIGLFIAALSIVVAVTRVIAGVHYPSDVICGLFIGYAAGALEIVIFNILAVGISF